MHCSFRVSVQVAAIRPFENGLVKNGPGSLVIVLVAPECEVHAVFVDQFLQSEPEEIPI